MNKTWIILLTGMLVIGLMPSAMANPKIDSNAQAKNDKQLTVTVDGANAADVAIDQILTNNGNQDNHNAGIGGNANAFSANVATQTQNAGNDNQVSGCNGPWSGVGGAGGASSNAAKSNVTDSQNTDVSQKQKAKSNGGDSNGDGMGGSGCNSHSSNKANQDQSSSATATGGEGNSGDVIQTNTVKQDAQAQIDVHQNLVQPVDIREFQVASAKEDSQIDFTIPTSVFDNQDSQISIPVENGNNVSEPGDKTN